MRIFLITAFPEIFQGPFSESIIHRAVKKGIVEFHFVYLRDFSIDKHNTIDDIEFGGSFGMVYKIEPIYKAFEFIKKKRGLKNPRTILTSARGRLFNQEIARSLADENDLVFICGHYKDVDHRVAENIATDEISIGDYILTGGELPAAVMIDATVRLLSGVLGNKDSADTDSFEQGLLDCPRFTRPADFMGMKVPETLLSGHHEKIRKWRKFQSIELTRNRRPDLWQNYVPCKEDLDLINEFENRRK